MANIGITKKFIARIIPRRKNMSLMRYAAIIVAATQSAINVQAVSIPQTLAISANFDQVEEEELVPQQMVLA